MAGYFVRCSVAEKVAPVFELAPVVLAAFSPRATQQSRDIFARRAVFGQEDPVGNRHSGRCTPRVQVRLCMEKKAAQQSDNPNLFIVEVDFKVPHIGRKGGGFFFLEGTHVFEFSFDGTGAHAHHIV